MENVFPDQYKDQQAKERFATPGPYSDLMAAMINLVRRTNVTVSQPAHLEPTVWSSPVDLSARIAVPAAAGNYVTAVTYQSPPGRWTRISLYGLDVQPDILGAAYNYNGSILWRFRKNGAPLGDGMSNWGEHRGSLVYPRETFILLGEDDTVEFQVQRAVAAAQANDVDMSIQGWTWTPRNTYEGTAASVTAY